MSDDLVKRLREDQPVTQDMGSTMQCALQDEAADRIQELEAKLAKAVEFTKGVIRHAGNSGDDYLAEQARTTLAELNGQDDEDSHG